MKYDIQEFNNVGSYMQLPEDVVSGLEECIASAFGGGITPEDAREHMAGQQVLVARAQLKDGAYSVKGFSSTTVVSPAEVFKDETLETEKGAYFAGAAVCRTTQGTGLYHMLNTKRMNLALESDVPFIFTRTQNPRVQEGITHSIEKLVDEGLIASYALSREIRQGVYGRMLTTTKPEGRVVAYDDLNYEEGDAAILTWRFQK